MAIMASSGGPPKTVDLQGKRGRVRGSAPFGGRNGLVCLGVSTREKYCHNGGMALAYHHGGAIRRVPARGVRDRHHGPRRGSLEAVLLQGKMLGVRDPRPLGAGMDSSAFFLEDARGTAPTGHGLADRLR
jgi:hypothetical protein